MKKHNILFCLLKFIINALEWWFRTVLAGFIIIVFVMIFGYGNYYLIPDLIHGTLLTTQHINYWYEWECIALYADSLALCVLFAYIITPNTSLRRWINRNC